MEPPNYDFSEKTLPKRVALDKEGESVNSNSLDNKPEDGNATDKGAQEEADGNSIPGARSLSEVTTNARFDANDLEANEQRTTTATLFPVTNLDQGIIGWDSQDDPENPQNFPMGQKWGLLALMSAISFISPLASSMFSPAVNYVATDLHVYNETLISFSVSIFLLGYAVS
jgi:hypothetical protein